MAKSKPRIDKKGPPDALEDKSSKNQRNPILQIIKSKTAQKKVLAASPDGLVGEEGILEVKCSSCKPIEVASRKSTFMEFTNEDKTEIRRKRSHAYYFQTIMQMYVSERRYCDFMIFHQPETGTECNVYFERIYRDAETDEVWKKMKTKLLRLYMLDMAPEIVDPMFSKFQKFRTPMYRQKAIEERNISRRRKTVSPGVQN